MAIDPVYFVVFIAVSVAYALYLDSLVDAWMMHGDVVARRRFWTIVLCHAAAIVFGARFVSP